jgi:hypothetical protein
VAIIYDLAPFMLVITVLLMGFSTAFAVSMPDSTAFDNGEPYGMGLLASGFLTTYLSTLGEFDMNEYTNAQSIACFVVFLFLIVVIMFNLLIAIMSDTFDRVMDSWVFEGRKMRVETIIEEELLMDDSHNAAYFPEFLQVLRPVEEAADEWSGVSGQISAVKEEVVRMATKEEVASVEQNVARVEGKVDALAVEMQANQALIMKQLHSMALQKADPYLY